MHELKTRLKKIEKLSEKADALLLVNFPNSDPNFFYFTNINVQGIFFYDFSEPTIFTSDMELSRARRGWIKNVDEIRKMSELSKLLKNKTIAVNKPFLTAEIFSRIKARKIDASKRLEEARAIKTRYEIAAISKACMLSKKAFQAAEKEISNKMTEIELKGTVDYLIAKNGCTPAFDTIVATGKNIAEPHHAADKTRLGEVVLVDFGLRHRGYVSDVTRTIGSKYENILQEAENKASAALKDGAKAGYVDKISRDALGKLSKNFITSLGHGIGIAVHEAPAISSGSKDILKEGMAVTIEPGIYLPNGGRHENDYLITRNSARCLTKF